MSKRSSQNLHHLRTSVAIAALALGALSLAAILPHDPFGGAALAQHDGGDDHGDDHEGSGGNGPGQPGGNPNPGGSGQGGGGHAGGQGGGHDGEEGDDSDGRGPQYGQPDDDDTRGGRPIWAQEGIPEVELGRLNVVRSPDRVLDQALAEALSNFTPEMAAFYNLTLDQAIAALRTDFDNLTIVDSPLENLGLLRDALDGSSQLSALGVTSSVNTLIPIFLGVAADKTLPITPETAYTVSYLLGFELTAAQATLLAEEADAVREAVLEGHG